jgi:hypothetical protein
MRRLFLLGAVALALAFLAVMAATGMQPVQRQLVKFEAEGVLRVAPEEVRGVTLSRGGRSVAFTRTSRQGWARADGGALAQAARTRIDTAVKMLHRSGPTREIAPHELVGADARSFGLDEPGLVAAVFGAIGNHVLTARFGGHNPEGFLQYMRLDGDERLYLMSRFVGAEFLAAFEEATSP